MKSRPGSTTSESTSSLTSGTRFLQIQFSRLSNCAAPTPLWSTIICTESSESQNINKTPLHETGNKAQRLLYTHSTVGATRILSRKLTIYPINPSQTLKEWQDFFFFFFTKPKPGSALR